MGSTALWIKNKCLAGHTVPIVPFGRALSSCQPDKLYFCFLNALSRAFAHAVPSFWNTLSLLPSVLAQGTQAPIQSSLGLVWVPWFSEFIVQISIFSYICITKKYLTHRYPLSRIQTPGEQRLFVSPIISFQCSAQGQLSQTKY